MSDPTRRFSTRVGDYVKYRPSYPPTVIELLCRECGLTPGWTVADIGSGPGNLTRLFLENGNRVYGVEPNREMCEAGEGLLGRYPGFTSIDGTAEATNLPDGRVELVAAGQAFHWFERDRARQEFRRILRQPGWVALIWNERRVAGTPFLKAYERLLETYGTDYAEVRHRDAADTTALDAFFGPGGYERASFENVQMFDLEGRGPAPVVVLRAPLGATGARGDARPAAPDLRGTPGRRDGRVRVRHQRVLWARLAGK